MRITKKAAAIIVAILILALAAPVFASQNITGPNVYGSNGQVLQVTRKLSGPEAWTSARASIELDDDEKLAEVFDIVPPAGYSGGANIEFICNGYTDATIYHYNGSWVPLNTKFDAATSKATAYTTSFSPFALVVTYHPQAPVSQADGISVTDGRGNMPGASTIHITNQSTLSTTADELNLNGNQTLNMYDVTNLSGYAPYTVSINIPRGTTNTQIYILGSTGTWNKVNPSISGNTATIQITDDEAIAAVFTKQQSTQIVLPAGTIYYGAQYWGNGVPLPNTTSPLVLTNATIVIQGPQYSNGYSSFYLDGTQYFMGSTSTTSVATVPAQTVIQTQAPAASQAPAQSSAPAPAPSIEPLPFF